MTRAVTAAAMLLCAACSAVVDPDDVPLRCAAGPGAANPCPTGLFCVEGVCSSRDATDAGGVDGCTPEEEICDNRDNDCDGMVDEGHDADGDGFTWCGGGAMALADCDDREAGAHPGDPARGVSPGTEECDGIDNDCDGVVDESDEGPICPAGEACIGRDCVNPADCTLPGNECAAGSRCDTTVDPHTCVTGGDCREIGCSSGEICDEATGNCVSPSPLGTPCATDAECAEGYCALQGALGLSPADARVCAKACCSDADCSGDTICYASGTGAKMCIPAMLVGRQRGPGGTLAACSDGSACASGFCGTDLGGCLGSCSAHADCGSGRSCAVYRRADSRIQNACYSGTGGTNAAGFCDSGSDCRFGICYEIAFGEGLCSGPCGTTAECPSGLYCSWQDIESSFIQLCYPTSLWQGDGTSGAGCSFDSDCRDSACVGGRCWDTCCNDADCGVSAHCRAVRFGDGRYEMHCNP